jgi:hypothetical protein
MEFIRKTFKSFDEYVAAVQEIFKYLFDVENATGPINPEYQYANFVLGGDYLMTAILDETGLNDVKDNVPIDLPSNYWEDFENKFFPYELQSGDTISYLFRFEGPGWEMGIMQTDQDVNAISITHEDISELIKIRLMFFS